MWRCEMTKVTITLQDSEYIARLEKERLDKLSTKQIAIDLFNIVSNGKYDMNNLVNYFDRIDEALAELEELKKDVARFMVLLNIYLTDTQTIEEMHERWALERKTLKGR